ncbi:negative cofactor 2 transcription regulator complex subunit ncb2 [Microbotryomycetes sp. JL221]|nr:negative cofactor 2 transcription regulator complex subunit ncb2 [Microbotryomycetes sp. JL221]
MDSDDDSGPKGFTGMSDDDVNLPKATINKVIQEFLPADFSCSKETKDLMAECCKEFVLAISSEANEICDKESKKTMAPEHIISALKGERQMKKKKQNGSGMSQEELLKAQEELFAASRAKMQAGSGGAEQPKTEDA